MIDISAHVTPKALAGPLAAALLIWPGAVGSSRAETLDEALAAAYTGNPTLLAARAELRGVNERVPQELSNYRPSAFVDGEGGVERIDNNSNTGGAETTEPWEVLLGVEQPLYRGGRTVAGVARAEAEVQAQRARLRSIEQEVLLAAVSAYMDVWRDEAVLQLNINNEKVLGRQLEATQDRFDVGELTRTDVAQSESRLARATAERIGAEGFLNASEAVYQEVIGTPPDLSSLEPPDMLDGLPKSQDQVVDAALENNPDVISARFDQSAAEHQIAVSRGQLLPEAFATGEARHSENFGSSDNEVDVVRAAVDVTVPIYQQGRVSSEVRQDKQTSTQRRREVELNARGAERRAIDAWTGLLTARAQSESFRSEVRSSEIALEGVRQENAVGARTILDILDAEQEFLDAQVNLIRAQRDEIVASYAVLAAMGLLTARDLGLAVAPYNPEDDYQAVRNRWFGLDAPGLDTPSQ
ncbi:MAG: TolC family outer membrane protein [Kiloniellales bacterium]|jgi:outer membrane protein|nr:TolC family outer membrane protein [Kiloniellales bacterium]